MSDIISQVWPEWHVEERLGQGSYGTVYRAVRSGHGHTSYAAIKVIEVPQTPAEAEELASSGMDESSVRSYFEQRARDVLSEIAVMEELKGAPNVVSVEDYQLVEREGSISWAVLVRMPLLQSLKDCFASAGQPDTRETARLGMDICRALSACHAKGVIHRDVKPENIFRGPYGYLLGDFGIARRLGPDASSAHTRAGAYPYMAPEVFAGHSYGANVDTYSLGLVLYRFLNNGRVPFLPPEGAFSPSDSERAVALRLAGRPLPMPVGADAGLAAIVLRATDPDPAKRFGSAAEMGAALEAWLNTGNASATTPQNNASAGTGTVILDPSLSPVVQGNSPAAPASATPQAFQNGIPSAPSGQTGQQASIRNPSLSDSQPSFGSNGTVWSGSPGPAAKPDISSVSYRGETQEPSGKRKRVSAVAVAGIAVAAAVAIVALLFALPIGNSNHSDDSAPISLEPATDASEPSTSDEAGGAAIKPGGYLIDDDTCTIKINDIYIDDSGDLRFDYTITNHTERTLDISANNDGWTVNGSSVDCVFCPTLEPGETRDDSFRIEGNSLPTSNLDEIHSIGGPLRVSRIETRYYDVTIPDFPDHVENGFAGSILADDDVCTIEATGTYFDSNGNLHVGLVYTNHSDEILDFFADGLWSVNGVYAETYFADTVDPEEAIDDDFFIEPDTMPTTDVNEIESIAGKLRMDMDDRINYNVSL